MRGRSQIPVHGVCIGTGTSAIIANSDHCASLFNVENSPCILESNCSFICFRRGYLNRPYFVEHGVVCIWMYCIEYSKIAKLILADLLEIRLAMKGSKGRMSMRIILMACKFISVEKIFVAVNKCG